MSSMPSASWSLLCTSLVLGAAAHAAPAAAPATPGPIVVSTATSPDNFLLPVSAVAADGSVTVAWSVANIPTDIDNVHVRRFDASGTPISAERIANTTRGTTTLPIRNDTTSVASDAAGNFVVAWYQITDLTQDLQLKARVFNADGSPRTDEFCVDPACSGVFIGPSQVLMANDGRFVVAYSMVSGSSTNVFARRFDANGAALDAQPITAVSTNHFMEYSAGINRQTGDFAFGWMTTEAIGQYRQHNLRKITKLYGLRYLASGATQGAVLDVAACVGHLDLSGMVSGCQLIANSQTLADDHGNLTFAWSQFSTQASGASITYVRHFNSKGVGTTPKVQLAAALLGTSAIDGAGNYVLKLDSGTRAYSANDAVIDTPAQLDLSSALTGSSSGGFVGSWLATAPDGPTVYAQPYTLP